MRSCPKQAAAVSPSSPPLIGLIEFDQQGSPKEPLLVTSFRGPEPKGLGTLTHERRDTTKRAVPEEHPAVPSDAEAPAPHDVDEGRLTCRWGKVPASAPQRSGFPFKKQPRRRAVVRCPPGQETQHHSCSFERCVPSLCPPRLPLPPPFSPKRRKSGLQ